MLNLREQRVLLVVAHPDDEILGVGATANKLIHEQNCTVKVVILSAGISSRYDQSDDKQLKKELVTHKENMEDAQKCIGFDRIQAYDFPDNQFDTVSLLDIVRVIEKEKRDFQSQIIFTHHSGDLNIDHQKTSQAVVTACRPMQHESTRAIISFETPSATEWAVSSGTGFFSPNFFVSVSKQNIEAKIKSMECYESERRKFPHPRSPEALETLARLRGIQAGCEFAEAFQIMRTRLT